MLMHKRATVLRRHAAGPADGREGRRGGGGPEHAWPLISAGKIGPVIDQVLPMAEAAQAHRLFDEGTQVGKILLVN